MSSFIGMITIFVPFIALSAVYAQRGQTGAGYGVVVCLFLFDIMYNVACNPLLYSYTTEVMPFYMRSRGLAVKNLVGQVAQSEEHTSELQSQSNLVCRLL